MKSTTNTQPCRIEAAAPDFVDQEAQRLLIERLARLTPIEYDRQKKSAAAELGCSIGALNAEVKRVRAVGNEGATDDCDLMFPEVVPVEDAVSPAALLDEIAELLRRYAVLPPYMSEAIALWIAFTWTTAAARVAPILALTSAQRRCGKTTAFGLIQLLVYRPLAASSISAAALFRSIDQYAPTLLIDEADTFLAKYDELRGVLNAGHTRNA